MSGYAVTAQYYDPLAASGRAGIDAQISAALAGLNVQAGPILDVGAGTGLTTALIAASLPDAEIWAIEPDPAMRPALMTRIWNDSDLRRRVSILPFAALEVSLPPVIAGAVLSASLVHFSPDERRYLWRQLAERLAPAGRIIVEIQCPEPVDIPPAALGPVRVGRIEYWGTAEASAVGDGSQQWTINYRAELDGTVLADETVHYRCWAVSGLTIAAEARETGMLGRIDGDLVIIDQI
jgi:SAM-dependent methyltransferase